LPLALAPLLSHLGPNKTLRILAIGVGVALFPSLTLLRGRLPINRIHGPSSRSSSGFFYFKDSLLWIIMVTNVLQSMAYVFSSSASLKDAYTHPIVAISFQWLGYQVSHLKILLTTTFLYLMPL
jgi:hypothetical protein